MITLRKTLIEPSATRRVLLVWLTSCLCACAYGGSDQPTPEAAKRFLKLRGYEFDNKSFFAAAAAGDEMAVNGFLSAGMNPNVKDQDDDTALTAAAASGDLIIVNALIKGGADVNAKGRNNWTALLLALQDKRDDEVVQIMLNKGADPRIKDVDGVNAAGWAAKNGRGNLIMILQAAEKNSQ